MKNEKSYKYWLFFLKDEELYKKYYNDSDYSNKLYAYTDQKELADEFKRERNMDVFHIVVKKLSSYQVNELARNYQELYITTVEGKTKVLGELKVVTFNLACTLDEKRKVNSECNYMIQSRITAIVNYNPLIFRSKYYKALEELNYVNEYSVMNNEIWDEFSITETYTYYDDLIPDFLSAFIYMYKELF